MIRPRNAGRIEVPTTILLALINMFMSIRTDSPTSSSNAVSAIGLWMTMCIIFVVFCLVGYGTILCLEYLARKMDLYSLFMAFFVFIVFNLSYWLVLSILYRS